MPTSVVRGRRPHDNAINLVKRFDPKHDWPSHEHTCQVSRFGRESPGFLAFLKSPGGRSQSPVISNDLPSKTKIIAVSRPAAWAVGYVFR